MKYKNLNEKEKLDWIAERISTSHTGAICIRKDLIKKYREIVGDFSSSDISIKLQMQKAFEDSL